MNVLQSLIFAAAVVLTFTAALGAITHGDGNFMALVWAGQIAGIGAILAVLAIAALQPDKPVKLKMPTK